MNMPTMANQPQPSPFANFNAPTYAKSIGSMTIVLAGLIFICYFIALGKPLTFYPQKAILKGQVWRPLLFPIGSSGFLNMIVNLFSVFFLGWMLEKKLGSLNFLVRIFANALLLSIVVETPIYFLLSLVLPGVASTIKACGMAPILAIETIALCIQDQNRKTSICGLPIDVPMIGIPLVCLIGTLLYGDPSVLFAIIAAYLHLYVFKSCGFASLNAQTAYALEKQMMVLNKAGHFYTMNDASSLSTAQPPLASIRPDVPLFSQQILGQNPSLPPLPMTPDLGNMDLVKDLWTNKFNDYAPLPENGLHYN